MVVGGTRDEDGAAPEPARGEVAARPMGRGRRSCDATPAPAAAADDAARARSFFRRAGRFSAVCAARVAGWTGTRTRVFVAARARGAEMKDSARRQERDARTVEGASSDSRPPAWSPIVPPNAQWAAPAAPERAQRPQPPPPGPAGPSGAPSSRSFVSTRETAIRGRADSSFVCLWVCGFARRSGGPGSTTR